MKPVKKIWITWESQRRTIEMTRLLPDVKLFMLQINAPCFVRYPYLMLKTLRLLVRYRPRLLFAQNPSVVLSLSVVILRVLFRFRVIVDAHNEGVKPFYSHQNWLLPIYAWIQKMTDLTIVTNKQLALQVSSNGGNPFILQDPLPQVKSSARISLKGKHNIVFVCTFEKDEPYRDVVESARFLDSDIFIYVTGRYEKAPLDLIQKAPSNIVFSGFLQDQDYINLLNSCDAVMDLTLMEDCLVCGAYEAVALGKPIILSDTSALRDYFFIGTIYTENAPRAIAHAIYQAITKKATLEKQVSILKKELHKNWVTSFNQLISYLSNLSVTIDNRYNH